MQKQACNNGPHETDSALPTVLQIVTALTESQHQALRDFASKRIRRLSRSPGMARYLAGHAPDDLVNSALEKLLLGDVNPKQGRKLAAKHRHDPELFLQCVMGIINSNLSNAVNSAEFSFPHLPLENSDEDPASVELPDPTDWARQLENRDVQRELFVRLRQQSPPELQPIINAWEPSALSDDSIARGEFDRRQVHRVRVLAREILAKLSMEMQPATLPTGMEMLM